MDGNGIGKLQLLELLKAVFHPFSLIKFHGQKLCEQIQLTDHAHIPVKYACALVSRDIIFIHRPLDLIVVLDLHHLVPQPEHAAGGFLFRFFRGRRV